mmetsp:Transcript_8366/g.37689  ORF Transcript_8366/g.37689 Transcript_8366/m.37689 type:complete len:257 (+) Transcript_8366:218-988(+)
MPYVMRSQSNARCIRSSVTISRIVLYQMRGPLNTTGHGSQTPTQMECLHDRMVFFTQLALPTVAILSVPSISRQYSSMDTKYGCAHSSYRNLRFFSSSALNAGGVSRWHHVAMTIVPPGLSTRIISSTYFFLSGMCSPDSHAHTKSKVSSGKSIASAFITRNDAFGRFCSAASSVALSTCFGERVMPVTRVSGPNVLAMCLDVPPMPHPTSSTFAGLSGHSDQASISSQKSSLASMKSFTLHPSRVPAPLARSSSL